MSKATVGHATPKKGRRTKRSTGVNNLVIVSDQHCNCRLGLFPSGHRMPLDDGGYYTPSPLQEIVWGWWLEFRDEWVPEVTRGEPFILVWNGDVVDGGAHHHNTTHISDNPTDQRRLALTVCRPFCKRAVRSYFVRGTEVHDGRSGTSIEDIAEELGAVPDSTGRFARWHLRLLLGTGLVDIAHHIGTTGSMAYESSAILKELEQIYVAAARWGDEPPDVVVRSHRHTNCEVRLRISKNGRDGFATSCTTPGWQLKTPFSHRIPGGRRARPQFGGTLVRFGDEEMYTRHYVKSIEEVPVEQA